MYLNLNAHYAGSISGGNIIIPFSILSLIVGIGAPSEDVLDVKKKHLEYSIKKK